jgi:hypothetical protein
MSVKCNDVAPGCLFWPYLVIVGISNPKHQAIPMSRHAVSMETTHFKPRASMFRLHFWPNALDAVTYQTSFPPSEIIQTTESFSLRVQTNQPRADDAK